MLPVTIDDCRLMIDQSFFAFVLNKGEASYNRQSPQHLNRLGTILYRSYNYFQYKRTADINLMVFRGINLDPSAAKPWKSIWTIDHCGEQTWSRGSRANFLYFYSLDLHYEKEISFEDWKLLETHEHEPIQPPSPSAPSPSSQQASYHAICRPLVYLNTNNHLIGATDHNPALPKKYWKHYEVWLGSRNDAEHFARTHLPVKWNLALLFRRNANALVEYPPSLKVFVREKTTLVIREEHQKNIPGPTPVIKEVEEEERENNGQPPK